MNVYLVFVEDCCTDITVPAVFEDRTKANAEAKRLAEEALDAYKVEEICMIKEEYLDDWEFESNLSVLEGDCIGYEVTSCDGNGITRIWVEERTVRTKLRKEVTE